MCREGKRSRARFLVVVDQSARRGEAAKMYLRKREATDAIPKRGKQPTTTHTPKLLLYWVPTTTLLLCVYQLNSLRAVFSILLSTTHTNTRTRVYISIYADVYRCSVVSLSLWCDSPFLSATSFSFLFFSQRSRSCPAFRFAVLTDAAGYSTALVCC